METPTKDNENDRKLKQYQSRRILELEILTEQLSVVPHFTRNLQRRKPLRQLPEIFLWIKWNNQPGVYRKNSQGHKQSEKGSEDLGCKHKIWTRYM